MNLSDLHRRLLQDVLAIGNAFPFVITGGYAVQAHCLVDRFSRDIDVATNSSVSMDDLASLLVAGLTERGWLVRVIGVVPRSARFMVTDPQLGEDCEVDILKEAFNQPPSVTPYEFSAYGLSNEDIADLRRWAQAWSDDINRRTYEPPLDEDDLP